MGSKIATIQTTVEQARVFESDSNPDHRNKSLSEQTNITKQLPSITQFIRNIAELKEKGQITKKAPNELGLIDFLAIVRAKRPSPRIFSRDKNILLQAYSNLIWW